MRDVSGYLQEQADALLKKEGSTEHWTADKVHESRVATRRVRMSLWWLEQAAGGGKKIKKARKCLKDFGRLLGERRQWDVLFRDAAKFGVSPNVLESQRLAAMDALREFHSSDKITKLEKKILKAVDKAKDLKGLDVSKPIEKLKKKLVDWQEHLPANEQEFHECRIDLKKTRYVLEALGLDVTDLKKIQDLLGEAHDMQVLQNYLGKNEKVAAAERKAHEQAKGILPSLLKVTIERLDCLKGGKS